MKQSPLVLAILNRLEKHNLPVPVTEYRFCPTRRWRFDLAYPDRKIAIEAEGGAFTRGRHTRGIGMTLDCEKYNAAVVRGWRVLRYTAANINQVSDDLTALMLLEIRGEYGR